MSVRAYVAALAAIALGLGCKPSVPQGVYACSSDTDCPANWFCHADDRCHASPPTGTRDAAATDAEIDTDTDIDADAATQMQADASHTDAGGGGKADSSVPLRMDAGEGDRPRDAGVQCDAAIGSAQDACEHAWTHQFGTAGKDRAYAATIDRDGHLIVVGGTLGDIEGDNAGGYDIFVIKYGLAGEELWVRQLGSSGDEVASGVATDADGNVYVVGGTTAGLGGNSNEASDGSEDVVVVKYDADGERLWLRQIGSGGYDPALAVAVDASSSVYVVGRTNGDFDGNTNTGEPTTFDLFVLKYDSDGDKLWSREFGSVEHDEADGVAVDASGNVYVAGATHGDLEGNTNAGLPGTSDNALIKYDGDGQREWVHQFGTSADDWSSSVATDAQGNVYVAGVTSGGLDGNTFAGGDDTIFGFGAGVDLFVSKFGGAGDLEWTKQLGSAGDDAAAGVATDASGDVYVAGSTTGDLDGENAGGVDVVVVKYASGGQERWIRQFGSADADSAMAIDVDGDGNAYVVGYTTGELDGSMHLGSEDVLLGSYDSSGDPR